MTMTPQPYPLWLASLEAETGDTVAGLIIGWKTDLDADNGTLARPLVVWVYETAINAIDFPSSGDTYFLGTSEGDARLQAEHHQEKKRLLEVARTKGQ